MLRIPERICTNCQVSVELFEANRDQQDGELLPLLRVVTCNSVFSCLQFGVKCIGRPELDTARYTGFKRPGPS